MAIGNPEEIGAPLGSIFFMSGRKAHGAKERVQAVQERQAYNEKRDRENLRKHLDKKSPAGLGELRNTDGSVIRASGTPARVG